MHGVVGLQILEGIAQFAQETLWVIAAMVGVAAVTVYLLAYMSRRFEASREVLRATEFIKARESRYYDVGTLDFVHRVLEWIGIVIFLIAELAIASFRVGEVREFLRQFLLRFWAILFVLFTLVVAALLIRALRRFGAYLRGELKTKPRRLATPRLWGVAELLLKYLTVAVAVLVAFVGAVDILPPTVPEREFLIGVRTTLTTPSAGLFNALTIAIVGTFVAFGIARFSDSVFEDLKQRSKKHGPKVMEQFKGVTRFSTYVIAFATVLFLELGLFLTPTQLVAIAVAFVMAVVLLVLVSYDSLRNAFAGIALMSADPFSVGDRVKIGEDLVGDIVSITLTMTQLRTGRGETVTLPNRQLLTTPVLNFTRSEHHSIFVEVSVGWDVPHETVEHLLLEAAKRTPGILEAPVPQVFGKDVAGNAIVHQLLAYTNDPEQMKQVKSALLYTIQDLFHESKLNMLSSAS